MAKVGRRRVKGQGIARKMRRARRIHAPLADRRCARAYPCVREAWPRAWLIVLAPLPPAIRQLLLVLSLLWLAGNGLRITILAVPPVIPSIRAEFGMSETQVGILTGLPQVLF